MAQAHGQAPSPQLYAAPQSPAAASVSHLTMAMPGINPAHAPPGSSSSSMSTDSSPFISPSSASAPVDAFGNPENWQDNPHPDNYSSDDEHGPHSPAARGGGMAVPIHMGSLPFGIGDDVLGQPHSDSDGEIDLASGGGRGDNSAASVAQRQLSQKRGEQASQPS